jgi:hypothetical protein
MQEVQQNDAKEADGIVAKRKTIVVTGTAGVSGSFIGLASHGPAGLFAGGLVTIALLVLEGHGTPEEYAKVAKYLGPGFRAAKRWVSKRRASRPMPKEVDQSCVTTGQAQPLPVTQGDEAMEELQPKPTLPTSMLPQRSPTFAQMRHLIAPERDILGFDGKHFISGIPFVQSVNVALIGLPRSGKTSCLRFHVAQAVMRGSIIRGWDLHGDVSSEMGTYFTIFDQPEEMIADCQWIQNERDRRNALHKRAKKGESAAIQQWEETREILYIVDEFVALMVRLKKRKDDRDLVADTMLSLIAEGAKLKIRVIIAGQTMPAALFGDGGSSARDIMSVKYAFQSGDRQASMLGIEFDAIKNLLHLISGEDCAGYAILDGGPLVHAILVSIPHVTSNDIRGLIEEYGGGEEDELMDYMISPTPREERHTEMLPVTQRQHVRMSGYDQHRQRLASRRTPVYATTNRQARIPEMPKIAIPEQKPEPTINDALAIWNEVVSVGGKLSRYSLRDRLVQQGFECGENKARDLLDDLKAMAEKSMGK